MGSRPEADAADAAGAARMPRAAPGDAAAAAGAAVAILEPLGPGIELAWAYANLGERR
jgi:hypothetical protein